MNGRFKRTLAVLLSCSLVFGLVAIGTANSVSYTGKASSASPVAGGSYAEVNSVEEAINLIESNPAAYDNNSSDGGEKIPVIILPGISQSISYLANEDGTPYINKDGKELSGGLMIIDESTIYETLIKNLLGPLCQTVIFQKDMVFTDAVYDTMCEALSIQASDLNGDPVNNLKTITYEYPVGDMTKEDRDAFYRGIPMQAVTDLIGEDYLYCFAFPLIGKPMESAQALDDYIQMVKDQKGVDKVNLISVSLGGTILAAYLDLEHVDGSDINQIINVVSLLEGCDLLSDFYARSFILDDEFIYSEFIPMILKETEGYATLGYIINIALRLLPRDVFEKTLTRAVDGVLDTFLLNCPQFWSMVAIDRYDELADRYLSDAEHQPLREIMDRFHTAQCNLRSNLTALKSQGVKISNICGYDLDFSSYDYNFFGIMKSSLTTSSDGIIDVDSTSLGATYAPADTSLPADYVPAAPGYISPDGNIDASTCLFPDNVWFFYDQHHEVGRNDVIVTLCGQIIIDQINTVADQSDAFPQFNGSRKTNTLIKSYLPECEDVLANSYLYSYDDVVEVQAAYDEAKLMLANTVCNAAETEACTERVLNALRRVGKRPEAEDPAQDQALEAVAKFLNDVLYIIFGAQGFSDWPSSHLPILP